MDLNSNRTFNRDYKKLEYKNPRKARALEARKNFRLKAIFVGIMLVLIGLMYLILFSGIFTIKNVNIIGAGKMIRPKLQTVTDSYLNSRHWLILSHRNMFMFSKNEWLEHIGGSYWIDSIDIDRSWPSTINIVVVERRAKIVWLTGQNCFNLDDRGVVMEFCSSGDESLVKIKDERANSVKINDIVIDKKSLEFILNLKTKLDPRLKTDLFTINGDNSTVTVSTFENFEVYFNRELDLDSQARRLWALLDSVDIRAVLPTTQYFDLRFGEKVYYK
jgi:cell division septal protein FtsQ